MTTKEKIAKYGEYAPGVPNLSPAQIERQDFVDNETFNFIYSLIPNNKTVDKHLEWDISFIHDVWEVVQDILVEKGICTEMEFYPYIEIPDAKCEHDFLPKNNDGLEECRWCFKQQKG